VQLADRVVMTKWLEIPDRDGGAPSRSALLTVSFRVLQIVIA
jgi:hypothetical protein